MPLPILLGIKGAIVLGKYIAGKAFLVKATAAILTKSIAAYGISTTISGVLVVGTVVGGVLWTAERIKHLRKAFQALENDNIDEAIYYFATLLNAIKGIDVDDLADTVQSCLQGIKVSAERAQEVHDLIEDLGSQITTAARKLK
jgi:hypothetical protein